MNIIQSTWNYKCPRCRKGDQFVKPLQLSNPLHMHDHCDSCGFNFEPEPGYYFGAMFVSYIWTAWGFLFIVGFTMLVLKWSITAAFALLIVIAIASYLFVLRMSRSIYLHLDNKYEPNKIKEYQSKKGN